MPYFTSFSNSSELQSAKCANQMRQQCDVEEMDILSQESMFWLEADLALSEQSLFYDWARMHDFHISH